MKVATKFVERLTEEERKKLIERHEESESFRERNRAHAILLSAERFPLDEIARICRADRDTVSGWMEQWKEKGEKGLVDEERSGRPPILTPEEQEKVVEIALQNPKFPHRQLSEIKRVSGKEISVYTLKNLLKKKTSGGKESD